MEKEKGIGHCGLACAVCSENSNCVGCRNEGCKNKDCCRNFRCCRGKGLNGCWECQDFPCKDRMLDNMRIRAFAKFIKEYGEEKLLECLERNEKAGVIYHYPGKLNGDYDIHETEEGIISVILHGK